jgi:hypothetical protein
VAEQLSALTLVSCASFKNHSVIIFISSASTIKLLIIAANSTKRTDMTGGVSKKRKLFRSSSQAHISGDGSSTAAINTTAATATLQNPPVYTSAFMDLEGSDLDDNDDNCSVSSSSGSVDSGRRRNNKTLVNDDSDEE